MPIIALVVESREHPGSDRPVGSEHDLVRQETSPAIQQLIRFRSGSDVDVVIVGAGITGIAVPGVLAGLASMHWCSRLDPWAEAPPETPRKASLLQGTLLGDLRRHAGDAPLRAEVQADLRRTGNWLIEKPRTVGVDFQSGPPSPSPGFGGSRRADNIDRNLDAAAFAGLDATPTADPGLRWCAQRSGCLVRLEIHVTAGRCWRRRPLTPGGPAPGLSRVCGCARRGCGIPLRRVHLARPSACSPVIPVTGVPIPRSGALLREGRRAALLRRGL